MARIFNIYFPFEEQMHNAVVSVRSTPFHTEYTLLNLNEDLLFLLPGNKILSRSSDHYVFQDASAANNTQLMDAIIRAVAEHLYTVRSDS